MTSRYTCLDGVRVLTHISLIALHTSLLMTGHLPFDDKLWQNVKTNYLFTTFQMGGIQVDIMFTISAFIFVSTLLSSYNDVVKSNATSLVRGYFYKRFCRFLPNIIVTSIIGTLFIDALVTHSLAYSLTYSLTQY